MLLFVAGDFHRKRRRLPRQTDEVPVQPLIDMLAFWALLALGAFCVAAAVFGAAAEIGYGMEFGAGVKAALVALGIAGAISIERSFIFWRRIRS